MSNFEKMLIVRLTIEFGDRVTEFKIRNPDAIECAEIGHDRNLVAEFKLLGERARILIDASNTEAVLENPSEGNCYGVLSVTRRALKTAAGNSGSENIFCFFKINGR